MDKVIVYTIIIVILAGVMFWGFQSGFFASIFSGGSTVEATPLPAGIVLFYGQGCPHCADVEKFISQNNIDQKVKITRLEVWYNKSNAALLSQVAQKCGIAGDSVGVPFLYAGNGKCYVGEVDVPNFLKIQAGIQ
jgi:glutaredoxin